MMGSAHHIEDSSVYSSKMTNATDITDIMNSELVLQIMSVSNFC